MKSKITVREMIDGLRECITALSRDIGNSYTARGMAKKACQEMLDELRRTSKVSGGSGRVEYYLKLLHEGRL